MPVNAGPAARTLVLVGAWSVVLLAWWLPSEVSHAWWEALALVGTLTLASLVGFSLAAKLGFEAAPLISDMLAFSGSSSRLWRLLAAALMLGVLEWAGSLLVLRMVSGPFSLGVPKPHLTDSISADIVLCLQGAAAEEIIFRLGLLTFLFWVLTRFDAAGINLRVQAHRFWVANVCQAVAFGALHVAQGQSVLQGMPWLVQVLGGRQTLGGLISGYLLCRYGIEAAIIQHALADGMLDLFG